LLLEQTFLPSVRLAQSLSPPHSRQAPLEQTLPVPHPVLGGRHTTQVPVLALQTGGVVPAQLASPVPCTQEVPLQIPLGALHTLVQLPQCAAVLRGTQVPPQLSCPLPQAVPHEVPSQVYGEQFLVGGFGAAQ
jgi:hypothetical protein